MENISASLERSVDEVVLMIHSVLAGIVHRATDSKLHSFKSNRASYPCGSHVQKESYFSPKALQGKMYSDKRSCGLKNTCLSQTASIFCRQLSHERNLLL